MKINGSNLFSFLYRFRRLLEKQNGGNFTRSLKADELFETSAEGYRITGIQFSAFPATISIAETRHPVSNDLIDCVPIQKAAADSDIVVSDNTYVWSHEYGYTKFQCSVDCTVNLKRDKDVF